MSLILAIEPDQRQAAQLANLVRGRLHADLVHATTTEGALTALAGIGDRVPDLVLVPSLLSAQEDAAIAGALRVIAAAANIRMLTIPMLADPEQPPEHRGVFAKLRARKVKTTPGGCDPAVFADQIAAYLAEAAAERRARQADDDLVAEDLAAAAPALEPMPAPVTAVREPVADPVFEPDVEPAPERVFARAFERPPAPLVERVVAPVVEAVAEAALETIETRPIVEDTRQPDVDESRPWLIAVPAVPTLEPAFEPEVTVSLDALAEVTPFIAAVEETPEALIEEAPIVNRRQRKSTRRASEDAFNLDALLGPLLSEIAATRPAPVSLELPLAFQQTASRAAAIPVVEAAVMAPPPPPETAVISAPAFEVAPPAAAESIAPPPPVSPVVAVAAALEPDLDPMFFAEDAHDGAAPAPNDRPAWLELIESLRQDIQRLKTQRSQPQAESAASPAPAVTSRLGRDANMTTSPAAALNQEPPAATPLSKIRILTPRAKAPKPVEDQWGFFDPEQCGFAALRAKLDEISARDEVSA